MRNIRLLLEYDGTAYAGWQKQPASPTVQETLERALQRLTGSRTVVHGSGRTDAGVHALGQVAAFRTESSIPAERFAAALNSVLPRDIVALASAEADPGFHPRFSAKSKTYVYAIRTSPCRPAMLGRYFWHCPAALDADAMRDAARLFAGTRDFRGFSCSGGRPRTTVRTVRRAEVERVGSSVLFAVEADGFLYKMVRSMAGTLVMVGMGKAGPGRVEEVFSAGRRERAGPSLPGCGLTLAAVAYDGYCTPLHGKPVRALAPFASDFY